MGLFPQPQQSRAASLMQSVRQFAGGNPEAAARNLMQTNPQFASFMRQNQGKSIQQIANEHGIDYGLIQQLMNM